MLLLYASKTANGAVVVAALVALGVLAMSAHSDSTRRVVLLASVAAAIGVGQLILFALVGAPGLNETLQDYFTRHFAIPDVENPFWLLLRRDVSLVPRFLISLAMQPIVLVVAALGLGPLLLARSAWATMWLFAGLGAALTVAIHPVLSEIPRLMAPAWVVVGFGGSLVILPLVGFLAKRGRSLLSGS
ncbi:MAG: hypothetical protein HYX57_12645 [Chloroflexi bacterium]|nr:hypothetical protein [Chloroflexota bacterium]